MDSSTRPLLVPRWKVIADYPKTIYEIGEIIAGLAIDAKTITQ